MFRHHHQFISGIALTLLLAAVAPSAASARIAPDPVPATAAESVQAAPRSIVTPGGYGLPAASNMPNADIRDVQAQGARVAHELAARDATAGGGIVNPAPPLMVRVFQANGFDWGDAGIGAAACLVLIMIALGGTLAVTRHRGDRTRDTTPALTN
jgi:hypothetical protein